jgi:dihydropteroate synthase
MIDPGIGFAKTYDDNLFVMKNLHRLKELGYPILLGTSRKSMIGTATDTDVDDRLEGTIATTVYGMEKGVSFFRVHDVKENVRAIKMIEAIKNV